MVQKMSDLRATWGHSKLELAGRAAYASYATVAGFLRFLRRFSHVTSCGALGCEAS